MTQSLVSNSVNSDIIQFVNIPNPFESEVFLSTKTFAEITFPKVANNVARSASVKSLGK
jgi:hypothetical protein